MSELTNETRTLELKNPDKAINLFGSQDRNLTLIEESMNVVIHTRGDKLEIVGSKENVDLVSEMFIQLQELLKTGIQIGQADIVTAVKWPIEVLYRNLSVCMKKRLAEIMMANLFG